MDNFLSLVNWFIWILLAPFLVFIFSFVFQFSYLECVQSGPFAFVYALYFLAITGLYITSLEEHNRPMDFL